MSTSQKLLERNIPKFYLFQLLGGVGFFLPVLVLFWQENGLSLTEVMILQSLFSIAWVLLEVPTGYVADRIGRKHSLAAAGFFCFLGMLIYSFSHGFWTFLIAEITWAVGTSLISGADSAFLYDTLKDLKRVDEYQRIWGKAKFLWMMSIGVTNIIGGFIGAYNYRATLIAMLPFILVWIPVAWSFKEPRQHRRVVTKNYIHDVLYVLNTNILQQKKMRWLMLYAGIIAGFNGAVLWLYQPYMSLAGLDVIYFGLVFASFQFVAAISSKYAHKIEEKLGQWHSLAMLLILVSVSYFLMANFIFLFSFSFAFLQQFVRGFSHVVITDYVNKLTKSSIRATVLSALSMSQKLIYALLIPFVGYIADVYTIPQALMITGITAFIIGLPFLFLVKKI